MEQLICERLKENLMKLKLGRTEETLNTLVAIAEKEGLSYISFLDRLFEEEVAAKEKRRIDMAMRMVIYSIIDCPTYPAGTSLQTLV